MSVVGTQNVRVLPEMRSAAGGDGRTENGPRSDLRAPREKRIGVTQSTTSEAECSLPRERGGWGPTRGVKNALHPHSVIRSGGSQSAGHRQRPRKREEGEEAVAADFAAARCAVEWTAQIWTPGAREFYGSEGAEGTNERSDVRAQGGEGRWGPPTEEVK